MQRTIYLSLIAVLLLVSACNTSQPAEPTPAAAQLTPTSIPPTPIPEPPTATPVPAEPTAAVTGAVTEEVTAEEPAEEAPAQEADTSAAGETQPDFDADAPPLVLAFIPQENPEKLIGDIEVISEYLEAELGFPVEGFVTQDHAAAVEALRNEEADVSFMGALPYVLAHNQVGAEVILAEVYRGSPTYFGRIFVRKDSGIESLEDLQGKSIAFADPISESGYLYPLDRFVQAGLLERGEDPQNFFSTVYFAGGYQQALQAVANGYVDAAGASQFADLLLTAEQFDDITWIAESEEIPSHTVIVRSGLDSARVEAFKQAMLKLNQPEYQHLLQHVYSPDGYVEATHEDYLSVERIAQLYGLIE